MKHIKEKIESAQVRIYFVAILLGALSGALLPDTGAFEAVINPALILMLFATFLQVPLTQLGTAMRDTRFIGALLVTNFLVLPAVSVGLLQFLPDDAMLRLAVLFVLLAPCIDYVIAFTHVGGGNARSLLAMTPALLLLQMLLIPVYLGLALGDDATELIQTERFAHAFVWLIAFPLMLAAMVQASGKRTKSGAQAMPVLDLLPVPATAIVLFVVMVSVMPKVGLAQQAALRAAPVYVAFAILAPLSAWLVARAFRLQAQALRTVAFSASYRNSLVILPFAFAVPGGVPVLPAVILTQTITELIFLPVYVRLSHRWCRQV